MKIAIFTNNYLPNPYGVSMSIESFRREFEKRGHVVYIFAPKFKGCVDENPNVYRFPSIDLKFKGIRFPIAIPFSFKMNKILKGLEIDVVHSQHPNLLGWEARRWAKKKNVPLVFTWHTLYDQYSHFAPLVPEKIAAWWTIRNAVSYADSSDQIIVPTPSLKKIIQNWGVSNNNIASISSGVSEEEFAGAEGNKIRKKIGIAKDEILLVLIGRITVEKNMAFLMRAAAGLLIENKKIKFLVCGGGNQISMMQKVAEKAGVSAQVVFAGLISSAERKDYFASGDIFVHASKSETQGMVLTEAMYAGLPIVAVNAIGVQDLVADNVNGLLVEENEIDFAKAVLKLSNDENLRKQFSENARNIAREKYTAAVCAEKMLKVYEQTIERKK